MIIQKYNITLQTVKEADAELIIAFRTDDKRSRFISSTNADVAKQKEWIRDYMTRELDNKEFYFIATDDKGERFATYRIYNMEDDLCEIGSWISKPSYDDVANVIKVDIMMKEFAFENLNYNKIKFEVKKILLKKKKLLCT
jgi:RimJ/RimL family protein N-acetyltransferase